MRREENTPTLLSPVPVDCIVTTGEMQACYPCESQANLPPRNISVFHYSGSSVLFTCYQKQYTTKIIPVWELLFVGSLAS